MVIIELVNFLFHLCFCLLLFAHWPDLQCVRDVESLSDLLVNLLATLERYWVVCEAVGEFNNLMAYLQN